MMTVRHMQIFLEVYRTMNITKASEALNMTQPAVTRSIQDIEHYYGVKLFERINHRIYPTELSKQLADRALHIVDLFDDMEKGLTDWDELGVLRVAATITLGNFLLPTLVSEFKKQRPKLTVKVVVEPEAEIQKGLMDNTIDIALLEQGLHADALIEEPFAEDRLVPVFPLDSPYLKQEKLLLSDLQDEPMLLREKGSAGRSYLDAVFHLHGIILDPSWESVSTQALVKAVHQGLGISFLPEQLVKSDVERGIVATRTLDDEPLKRKEFLCWHRDKFLTPSAKLFLSLAREMGKRQ